MKFFFLVPVLVAATTSCTTLENRRDLYRSPAEGYERWYREPPPTRLPASAPGTRPAVPGAPRERNGVIAFPEESALPEHGQ